MTRKTFDAFLGLEFVARFLRERNPKFYLVLRWPREDGPNGICI
jgi:hypothetical protein